MTTSPSHQARRELAGFTEKLVELESMTVGQLASRYLELFGRPSRSRNKGYLKKQLAWRIQELAEGGLSELAKQRIAELMPDAEALLMSMGRRSRRLKTAPAAPRREWDSRLPPPGTVLERHFGGRSHRVLILADGFEYEGNTYRSLSQVARVIAGTRWNGFTFWGLNDGGTKNQ